MVRYRIERLTMEADLFEAAAPFEGPTNIHELTSALRKCTVVGPGRRAVGTEQAEDGNAAR